MFYIFLKIHLKPSARWLKFGFIWVFQKENDPKHLSELDSDWLKQTNANLVEWTFIKSNFFAGIKGVC
uniref:Uncharacterized protein n=1 Tax=Nothobranchius furzeri TaxID=105023 RepID=A0A8C6KDX1_NOTFU